MDKRRAMKPMPKPFRPHMPLSIHLLLQKLLMEFRLSSLETEESGKQERQDKLRAMGIVKDAKARLLDRQQARERAQTARFARLLVEGLREKTV